MKNGSSYQLDIEMPHIQSPLGDLANDGERFGQQIIQRFTVRMALLELRSFCGKLGIREFGYFRFKIIYLGHERDHFFHIPITFSSKD
jgi:hypothetical protein